MAQPHFRVLAKHELDYDTVLGMFLGAAMGDALGAPHEFCDVGEFTGKLQYEAKCKIPFQGYKTRAVGQVTDDTEMALTLARHLLAKKKYSSTQMITEYMEWAHSGGGGIGRNTAHLFKKVKTLKGYQKHYDDTFPEGKEKKWTQSNGGLMRCYPLALLSLNSVCEQTGLRCNNKVIKKDVSLTNPHPVCIETNEIYVFMLWHLLRQELTPNEIWLQVQQRAQTKEVKDVIKSVITFKPQKKWSVAYISNTKESKTRGWCLNGLYFAFKALLTSESYESFIAWIISFPISDTDTNASIAGAILGAKLGYQQLKQEPLTNYNMKVVRQCNTKKSDYVRPRKYLLKDIRKLTTALWQKYR